MKQSHADLYSRFLVIPQRGFREPDSLVPVRVLIGEGSLACSLPTAVHKRHASG